MVMDFETPGDNLFTRNFAELATASTKTFRFFFLMSSKEEGKSLFIL